MDLPDLQNTPATGAPVTGRRRRWALVSIVIVLLAACGALGATAWVQRDSAASWRDRAADIEAQLDVAVAQRDEALERADAAAGQRDELAAAADELREQLDTAVASLRVSERDVVDLEARLRVLADDRAEAADARILGEQQVAALQAVSQRTAQAVDGLDACVEQLADLRTATTEALAAADGAAADGAAADGVAADDVAADDASAQPDGSSTDRTQDAAAVLDRRAVQVASACEQAQSAAAEAGAAADLVLAR